MADIPNATQYGLHCSREHHTSLCVYIDAQNNTQTMAMYIDSGMNRKGCVDYRKATTFQSACVCVGIYTHHIYLEELVAFQPLHYDRYHHYRHTHSTLTSHCCTAIYTLTHSWSSHCDPGERHLSYTLHCCLLQQTNTPHNRVSGTHNSSSLSLSLTHTPWILPAVVHLRPRLSRHWRSLPASSLVC